METILLGLVLIVCIYILYCICTPAKEPFIGSMSQSEEERLGALATTINSPTNTDRAGNNPTNFIASVANILTAATATNIQNTYNTALGNPNTGPRIDDNTSLLYMIDFCYHGAKVSNPFSDPAFVTNCGICMTTGTLVDGRPSTGSNLGVVVYPEDKAYSLSQGIDAAPSAHTATCAPLIKTSDAGSNVTSLAINAQQYAETQEYIKKNNYSITSGIGSGRQTVSCPGTTATGHPNVIKDGGYRYGAWDTRIGSQVDYNRVNQMTTTPFDPSCIEQPSCTFTTSSLQWDAYTLCGNPNPTPVTGLKVRAITATGMTFTWDASSGKYGDTFDYKISPAGSMGIKGTNSVVYDNLNPETTYTFTLTVRNSVGNAPTVSVQGRTQDDRVPMSDVTFSAVTTTGFTVKWAGCDNATGITLKLDGPGNPASKQITPPTNSFTYTDLQPGSTYTFSASCAYQRAGILTTTAYTQRTGEPPRIPMSGVSFSGVTSTGFTVTWSGCENATGVTLNLAGPGNPSTQQITPPTNSYTYSTLSPGSSYTFSATCTYAFGNPLTSSSYTQRTGDAPRIPMSGVSFSGITTTGFTVRWSGCDNATGITLKLDGPGNPLSVQVTPSTNSYTYSTLSPESSYTFSATCTYPYGNPLTSSSHTQRTGDAPRIPMSGVSFSGITTTGFTVRWAGCDNATGITLNLSGPGNPASKQITPPTNSFTYTDLQPGSTYTFSATCTYASGSPLTSSSHTQSTSNPPPPTIGPPTRDLPTNVTAKFVGDPANNFVEISFTTPSNPNYNISTYRYVAYHAGLVAGYGTGQPTALNMNNLIGNLQGTCQGAGSSCVIRGQANVPWLAYIILVVFSGANQLTNTDAIPIAGAVPFQPAPPVQSTGVIGLPYCAPGYMKGPTITGTDNKVGGVLFADGADSTYISGLEAARVTSYNVGPAAYGQIPLYSCTKTSSTPSTQSPAAPPPPVTGLKFNGTQPTNVFTDIGISAGKSETYIFYDGLYSPRPKYIFFIYSNSKSDAVPKVGTNVFPAEMVPGLNQLSIGARVMSKLNNAAAFPYVAAFAVYDEIDFAPVLRPDQWHIDLLQYTIPASAFVEIKR